MEKLEDLELGIHFARRDYFLYAYYIVVEVVTMDLNNNKIMCESKKYNTFAYTSFFIVLLFVQQGFRKKGEKKLHGMYF